MRAQNERIGRAILSVAILAGSVGCGREPLSVAPAPGPSEASAARSTASVAASASAEPAPPPSSASPAASVAPAAPSASPALAEEPSLLGADGEPLPQTEERPSVTSERFTRRMRKLADAILSGDPEPARSSFFPLVAYAQVKDVQKPERDYRYRLMAHFERDVREYRKALGKDAEHAEFLGVVVPEERAAWMKPGKEGNRLGYFRVLRSQLRFRLASGRVRELELTSMISWRGEWYVVHLHGFE